MAKLVSKTYSSALFEVAIESNLLDQILDEFEFVVNSFIEYPSFYEIVESPKVNNEEKKKILSETFGEKISKELNSFIMLLVDKKRINFIKEIFVEFKSSSNEYKGLVIAEVQSVISLEESESENLKVKLNELTGKTVTIKNIINPNIMGGLIVKVGDKIIDGSLKTKLEDMKHDLAQIII